MIKITQINYKLKNNLIIHNNKMIKIIIGINKYIKLDKLIKFDM